MKTLIVLPVFNEIKTLKLLLSNLYKIVKNFSDVLVIDDGSTDGSDRVIDKYKNIIKINHYSNLGYGKSLIDGFNFAIDKDYKIVITMDSDFQHCPETIPVFKKNIENADIVSGSRYLKPLPSNVPFDRVQVNKEITSLINKHTTYNITDAFCGFKAYQTDALRKLNLTEKGYGLPVQLWIQASKIGLKIKEISVKAIYCDRRRNFKGQFDNVEQRLKYYKKILYKELSKTADKK